MNLYEYFYRLVMQIPRGRISTYGALANALGDIRAARACGVMLSQNPDPPRIPCHRVVMSDGSLGGFTHPQGLKRKIELLRNEGIRIANGKVADFDTVFFDDFDTSYPLKTLKKKQNEIKSKLIIHDAFDSNLVGGVDLSYSGRLAFGALVIMDEHKKIKEIITKKMRVDFPYIPTYLAFREEPLISMLLREIDEEIILFVDGNGILHPRYAGVATHVGVKNDVPTVGVAKSLLFGKVIGNRVIVNDRQVGWFVKSGRKKGIYISPGHKVSLNTSLKMVKNFLKYKIPEPLRLAHIHANEMRKQHIESGPS